MQAESGKRGPKISLQLRKASRRHLYQIRRFVSRPVRQAASCRGHKTKKKEGRPLCTYLLPAKHLIWEFFQEKNHKSTIAK